MKTTELGKIVREKRKVLKMSQADLALAAGTGVRFVSELERGKQTCAVGKTLLVLATLGLDVSILPRKGL